MSYSRWSNSAWYCFESCYGGEDRDNQVLSLWYDMTTTKNWYYHELVDFTEERLTKEYPNATIEEIKEAMGYIKNFIEDCEGME